MNWISWLPISACYCQGYYWFVFFFFFTKLKHNNQIDLQSYFALYMNIIDNSIQISFISYPKLKQTLD